MNSISLNLGIVTRSTGRTFHAALSYNLGSCLTRTDLILDGDTQMLVSRDVDKKYLNKFGVVFNETLAPVHAPTWVYDHQILSDKVQESENRKDSREGRSIIIALQKEFTLDTNKAMLRKFINKNVVSLGLVANFAIHYDDMNNPHAHVIFTTRRVTENGFEVNKEYISSIINSGDYLDNLREDWANYVNEQYIAQGSDKRVTHLSYEKLGLDILPTIHEGYYARKLKQAGAESERINTNKVRLEDNLEKFLNDSDVFVELMCTKYTKFNDQRILVQVHDFVSRIYKYSILDDSKTEFNEYSNMFYTKVKESKLLEFLNDSTIDGDKWYNSSLKDAYNNINEEENNTGNTNDSVSNREEVTMKKYSDLFGLYADFIESHGLPEAILNNPDKLLPEFGFKNGPRKNAQYNTQNYSLVEGQKENYAQKVSLVYDDKKQSFFINDIPNQGVKDENGKSLGTMNLISYIQKREGVNLEETLEKIASCYDISVDWSQLNKHISDEWKAEVKANKESVTFSNVEGETVKEKIDNLVHNYLISNFRSGKNNKELRQFLADSRKMTEPDIDRAIKSWKDAGWLSDKKTLNKYLKDSGVNETHLAEYYKEINADSKKSYIGMPLFDTHQLTFTIKSPQGRVLGFVQRRTKDTYIDKDGGVHEVKAKYKVSSGTERGSTLFGLNYVAKGSNIVYVEGYIDAVNPNSFTNREYHYVASGGVDFNQNKAAILAEKEPQNITVFLDNDEVGQKNIKKTIGLLVDQGIKNIKVARPIEKYKDADELLNAVGIKALEQHIKLSYSLSEYYYSKISSFYSLDRNRDLSYHAELSSMLNEHVGILEKYDVNELFKYLATGYQLSRNNEDIFLGQSIVEIARDKLPSELFNNLSHKEKIVSNSEGSPVVGLENIENNSSLVVLHNSDVFSINFFKNRNYNYVSVNNINPEVSETIASIEPKYVVLNTFEKEENEIRKSISDLKSAGIKSIFVNDTYIANVQDAKRLKEIEQQVSLSSQVHDYLYNQFILKCDKNLFNIKELGIEQLAGIPLFEVTDQFEKDIALLENDNNKELYINKVAKYLRNNKQDDLIEILSHKVQINKEVTKIDNIIEEEIEKNRNNEVQEEKIDQEKLISDVTNKLTQGFGVFDGNDFERIIRGVSSEVSKELKREIAEKISQDSFEIIRKTESRRGLFIHKLGFALYTDNELIERIKDKVNQKELYQVQKRINEIRDNLKQEEIDQILKNDQLRKDDIVDVVAYSVAEMLVNTYTVFTSKDVIREIDRKVNVNTVDKELRDAILKQIHDQGLIKELGRKDLKGNVLYSTPGYLKIEESLIKNIGVLNSKYTFEVKLSEEVIDSALNGSIKGIKLNQAQKDAVRHLLNSTNIVGIRGISGSGKSALLTVYKDIISDYSKKTIIGVAVTGPVSQNLGNDLESENTMTIHMLLKRIENGQVSLNKNTVLVVDEAGQVGADLMKQLTDIVVNANAKMVLIGAENQAQPVQSAQVFDLIDEKIGFFELDEVIRQKHDWQREATRNFDSNDFESGIGLYKDHGFIIEEDTSVSAINHLALDYAKKVIDNESMVNKSIVLAYTNETVEKINILIRGWLEEAGYLKNQKVCNLATSNDPNAKVEEVTIAEGEKIMFLRNEYKKLNIRNGTIATVLEIDGEELIVKTARDNRILKVNLKEYNNITHGYAVTIDKWQGSTEENVYALLSNNMNSTNVYPMLTRHKDNLYIYYAKNDFESDTSKEVTTRKLANAIGKDRFKINASSYIEPEDKMIKNNKAFGLVKNYKEKIDEINNVIREISNDYLYHLRNSENTTKISDLIDERSELSADIIINYRNSRRYLQEAGTVYKSMLEEYAGVTERRLRDEEAKEMKVLETFKIASNEDKILAADSLIRRRIVPVAIYRDYFDAKLQKDIVATASLAESLKGYVGEFAKVEKIDTFFGLTALNDTQTRNETLKLFNKVKKDYDRLIFVVSEIAKKEIKIKEFQNRAEELQKEISILEIRKEDNQEILSKKSLTLKKQNDIINNIKNDEYYKKWNDEKPKLITRLGRFTEHFDFNQFATIAKSVDQTNNLYNLFNSTFSDDEQNRILQEVNSVKNIALSDWDKLNNKAKEEIKSKYHQSLKNSYYAFKELEDKDRLIKLVKKDIDSLKKPKDGLSISPEKMKLQEDYLEKLVDQKNQLDSKKIIQDFLIAYELGKEVLSNNVLSNFDIIRPRDLHALKELDFQKLMESKKVYDEKRAKRVSRILETLSKDKKSKSRYERISKEIAGIRDYSVLKEFKDLMKAKEDRQTSEKQLLLMFAKELKDSNQVREISDAVKTGNKAKALELINSLDYKKNNLINRMFNKTKLNEVKDQTKSLVQQYFSLYLEREERADKAFNHVKLYNETSFDNLTRLARLGEGEIQNYNAIIGALIIHEDRKHQLLTSENISRYNSLIPGIARVDSLAREDWSVIDRAIDNIHKFSLNKDKVKESNSDVLDQKVSALNLDKKNHKLVLNAAKLLISITDKTVEDLDLIKLKHVVTSIQTKDYDILLKKYEEQGFNKKEIIGYKNFAVSMEGALKMAFDDRTKQYNNVIPQLIKSVISHNIEHDYTYNNSSTSDRSRDHGFDR